MESWPERVGLGSLSVDSLWLGDLGGVEGEVPGLGLKDGRALEMNEHGTDSNRAQRWELRPTSLWRWRASHSLSVP